MIDLPLHCSMQAEQAVLGALLISNTAFDNIPDLQAQDFYHRDHRKIFTEISSQISSGKICDVISLYDALGDEISEGLVYLHQLANSTPSAASIRVHAQIVIDYAKRRKLITLCREAEADTKPVDETADRLAAGLEQLAEGRQSQDPLKFADSLVKYVDLLQDRMQGRVKPIATGFADLDRRLDGGFERGTLTVLAARPSMGKTAFGLALARNAAETGSAAFLSMEMPASQIIDRNLAALGRLPISWLRNPIESDEESWNRLTAAFEKSERLNLWVDDQTNLNLLAIRSKARYIKRRAGLDLLVIDQLSFITGGTAENKSYEIGEYTRGLLALAKELDCVVVLLAQLNRDCEKRVNKRPILSDLSSSGSIEQDASNVIFLYRDEVYNPDTQESGVCEVITAKQRQGEIGTVALTYIGSQTRFENLAFQWKPPQIRENYKEKSFM